METEDHSKERQLAITIVQSTSPSDQILLQQWITQLLVLKDAPLGKLERAKKAIAITASSKAAIAAAKIVTRHVKRVAWDERSTAARFGLGGAALGLAAFGSQGAGIAALGTAVGVPLWVVSGAGASLAGVLLDELNRSKKDDNSSKS
jgi:hypothetical protein